jgi:hypothetical protein
MCLENPSAMLIFQHEEGTSGKVDVLGAGIRKMLSLSYATLARCTCILEFNNRNDFNRWRKPPWQEKR